MEKQNPPSCALREQSLDDIVNNYLSARAALPPRTFQIKADSEHMLEDLEAGWEECDACASPDLDQILAWENGKLELWHLITSISYPLVDTVKARYALLTVYIGADLKPAFVPGDGRSLYAVFDAGEKLLRYRVLAPHEANVPEMETPIDAGMLLICQPSHHNYYRKRTIVTTRHRHEGNIFRMIEAALAKLYAAQAEKNQAGALGGEEMKMIEQLIDNFRRFQTHVYSNYKDAASSAFGVTGYGRESSGVAGYGAENPGIAGSGPEDGIAGFGHVDSLSYLLPPAAYFLERRLLGAGLDKRLSSEFRQTVRHMAEELRTLYPEATVAEAAFAATTRIPLAHGDHAASAHSHRPEQDRAHKEASHHPLPEPEPEI